MKCAICKRIDRNNELLFCILVAIPSLDQIFFDESVDIVAKKWTIFAWIMSFNEKVIEKLKLMPMKYLLIAATLYALVKVNHILKLIVFYLLFFVH